jgi:hypothetical protein
MFVSRGVVRMLITKISAQKPNRLSKTYILLADGTLQKSSAGLLVEGKFEVLSLVNVKAFATFLPKLKNNEALCYGRPVNESGTVMSKKRKAKTKDIHAITFLLFLLMY